MKRGNPIEQLADLVSARRVFAKPVEGNGATVIPAAIVVGGGGGGDSAGDQGSGAGFGVWAFPVGAYVVRDGRVRWKPAIDVNWLVLLALLALRIVLRHVRETR